MTFSGEEGRFERLAQLIWRYEMFPAWLLTATVCEPDGRLVPGTTVVQRIFIGPAGVESGVRVTDLFDEVERGSRRAGFECVTLAGHPERGVERFTLSLDSTGERITFAVDSRSRLAAPYAILGAPIARAFQRRAVRTALRHIRDAEAPAFT